MKKIAAGLLFQISILVAGSFFSATVVAQQQPPRDAAARAIYSTYCSGCHGADLSGGRAPSLFRESLLREKSDMVLAQTIRKGMSDAGMPAFENVLSDAEVAQVLVFIRNESAVFVARPVFVPSPDNFIVKSEKQDFLIEVLARGLDVPWGLTFLDDGRLLITERSGKLRVFRDGKLDPLPVVGTPTVHVGQDAGLFDVIAHPKWRKNGWIYLSYAEAASIAADGKGPARAMTVVVRGKIDANNRFVDIKEIFRAPLELYTSSGAHFGSRFLFDRDDNLFYSLGDRGNMANAQDLSSPLGKVHRVRDDGSVPSDNPFVGVPGAIATIWTYGHRNPQGFSIDSRTGLLWESEHGPTGGDEINVLERGKNYGWGVISMGLERGISQTSAPGMEQPVVYYTPALAPSGITFYEGRRFPKWRGNLLVAGLAGQQLRRLEISGRKVVHEEALFTQFGRTRAVTTGPDGLIYVLLQNPTGSGTGLRLSDPTPGILIRLRPIANR